MGKYVLGEFHPDFRLSGRLRHKLVCCLLNSDSEDMNHFCAGETSATACVNQRGWCCRCIIIPSKPAVPLLHAEPNNYRGKSSHTSRSADEKQSPLIVCWLVREQLGTAARSWGQTRLLFISQPWCLMMEKNPNGGQKGFGLSRHHHNPPPECQTGFRQTNKQTTNKQIQKNKMTGLTVVIKPSAAVSRIILPVLAESVYTSDANMLALTLAFFLTGEVLVLKCSVELPGCKRSSCWQFVQVTADTPTGTGATQLKRSLMLNVSVWSVSAPSTIGYRGHVRQISNRRSISATERSFVTNIDDTSQNEKTCPTK